MSWLRLIAFGVCCLALSGCGFRPLYGTSGVTGSQEVVNELSAIDIRPIADRRGQVLRDMLEEKLQPRGRPATPQYQLQVRLNQATQLLGVRTDATSSRANLIVTATYELYDQNRRIVRERVQSVVSYNILDDQYATIASEADAEERALTQISEELRTRLAVFFDTRLAEG